MSEMQYTKRLGEVFQEFSREFRSVCSRKSFNWKIQQLRNSEGKSNKPELLKDLYNMFDSCGITYEKNRDNDYYEKLISTSKFPDFDELEAKILQILFSKFRYYPSPEEYMLRIVERMTKNSFDNWNNDTLRLRILKQFIKYGDYLRSAGFGSRAVIKNSVNVSENEICDYLNDNIFDVLKDSKKEDRQPDGKFGLLKIADDLASGKFRTEGASKKALYLFAMVFGMTYGKNDDTDIEKNLFQDYYTNNLMRYISECYIHNPFEFEADPSGQGINYKNFAEMVYLYFIAQNNYDAKTKIKLSSEMINRLRNSKPSHETSLSKFTGFYKSRINEALNKNPDEFENFIRDNYNCHTGNLGVLQLETDQNTALNVYLKILSRTQEIRTEQDIPSRTGEGLWFTDTETLKIRQLENLKKINSDEKSISDFIELLGAVNKFLSKPLPENPEPEDITRTMVVTAYYYYFTTKYENNLSWQWDNFETLFNGMKTELDMYLNKAGYQPFSNKIIFDVLTAFSAWVYTAY